MMLTLPVRIEVPPPECRKSGQGPLLPFTDHSPLPPERNGLAASGALDGLGEIGIGADARHDRRRSAPAGCRPVPRRGRPRPSAGLGIAGIMRARIPQIGDAGELGIGHVRDEIARRRAASRSDRPRSHARRHSRSTCPPTSTTLGGDRREPVGVRSRRRREHAAEERAVAPADDDRRTLGRVSADAARMVDVVVGEHDIAELLAGIFLRRGVDDPLRLAVIARRVEGDEIVVGRDDQRVVAAAGDMADVRRDVDQLEALAVIRIQSIGVEIEARSRAGG